MSTNKEKYSWLTGLLTGWGIKQSWAKIIAGAVIGALCAAGILTVSGCNSVTPAQLHTAHELYHVLTDTNCKLAKPDTVVEPEQYRK